MSEKSAKIEALQQACWHARLACLQWHQGRTKEPQWYQSGAGRSSQQDPRPEYHNLMIQYYSVLRPYLKDLDNLEEYWKEKEIEGVGNGLKSLDDWRFKTKSRRRDSFDPSRGSGQDSESGADYLEPRKVTRVVDILDEVSIMLGFGAEADEPDQKTEITEEKVRAADERAAELKKKVANGEE